jgi:hypothetical protein
MDIFSKSKPDLINHKTIRQISKIFQTTGKQEPSWKDNMGHFYIDYIRPNLFPLVVIFLVFIFLSIRYFLKRDRETTYKKHKSKKNKNKRNFYVDNYIINKPKNDNPYIQKQNFNDTDIEDRDDGEKSIYTLEQEYRASLENNKEMMSDQMIKELYETRGSKMSFDELARVVAGGD